MSRGTEDICLFLRSKDMPMNNWLQSIETMSCVCVRQMKESHREYSRHQTPYSSDHDDLSKRSCNLFASWNQRYHSISIEKEVTLPGIRQGIICAWNQMCMSKNYGNRDEQYYLHRAFTGKRGYHSYMLSCFLLIIQDVIAICEWETEQRNCRWVHVLLDA